jgi:hypothetical protein
MLVQLWQKIVGRKAQKFTHQDTFWADIGPFTTSWERVDEGAHSWRVCVFEKGRLQVPIEETVYVEAH